MTDDQKTTNQPAIAAARAPQETVGERVSKFDAETRDLLRKHDEDRRTLINGRASEREALMAEKLVSVVGK